MSSWIRRLRVLVGEWLLFLLPLETTRAAPRDQIKHTPRHIVILEVRDGEAVVEQEGTEPLGRSLEPRLLVLVPGAAPCPRSIKSDGGNDLFLST